MTNQEAEANIPSISELNDMTDAIENELGLSLGRKLVFKQKCTIVAFLLKRPVFRPALAVKFRLSPTTLSYLSRSIRGGSKGGKLFYTDVYKEYHMLGEDAFIDKYYDTYLHFELVKIMHDNNLFRKGRATKDQMLMRALREGTTRSRPD